MYKRMHILSFLLSTLAVIVSAPWSAYAQDPASEPTISCRAVENCLCAPAGDSSGIYIGRVGFGDPSTSIEVAIEQIVVGDELDPTPPDSILVRFDGIRQNDRILFSSRGYLIERGGGYSCPSGTPGERLVISAADARRLMRATSCFAELSTTSIGGSYPPCNASDAGGALCAHAPVTATWPMLFALLGLVSMRRRRS